MTEKQLAALIVALRALVPGSPPTATILDALRAVEDEEAARKASDNMAEVA